MTEWRKQQLQLENAYAQAMLHEDGIVETTTKRQWANGTRQFKLPTFRNILLWFLRRENFML